MKHMLKVWYQTRDKIKNFLWVIRHPLLTVRLAYYPDKKDGIIEVSGHDHASIIQGHKPTTVED